MKLSELSYSRWIIAVVLVLLSTQIGITQTYSFKHFGIEKNVFPSRIEAVNQASSGELLVGSLAGLVLYDGIDFSQITVNDGLTENAISTITVSGDDIWLGHWTGNITKLNLKTKDIKKYVFQEDFNFNTISSIVVIGEQELLITTNSGGLFRFNNDQIEQESLFNEGKGLSINKVIDGGEQVYACGGGKIFEANKRGDLLEWKLVFNMPNLRITDATRNADGTWLVGSEEGVYIVNNEGVINLIEASIGLSISSIAIDSNQYAWIATKETGLIKYDLKSHTSISISRENGLSYDQVRRVFIDNENSLWVATAAGLDQYLGEAFTFYDFSKSTSNSLIWDFIIEDNNNVLAATGDGLISCSIPYDNSNLKNFRSKFPQVAQPHAIHQDKNDKSLWVLSENGELWKTNAAHTIIEKFNQFKSAVRCIEEVGNEIWLGTDNGITVLNGSEVVANYNADDGLGGQKVNGIFYNAKRSEVWITFLGGYVTVFRKGRFKQFNEEHGLTSKVIQDAVFDESGNLWLASYDQGLFYCESESFVNISTSNGLTSNTTYAIDIDEKGNLWIGHNWGLDYFEPIESKTNHFGVDEGFMGIEVNPRALKVAKDGRVWVGTLMGLLQFNPHVHFTNRKEVNLTVSSAILGQIDLLKTSREVSSGSNDFHLDFKGISLLNPDKNRFLYRLKGLHDNWKETKSFQQIQYLSLPPGKYSFELKACNNDGICTSNPFTISFTVNPPFYRAWWFYTLIFILAFLIIIFMDRYRVVSLLQAKNELSEEIEGRDQKIVELEQELSELIRDKKQDKKLMKLLSSEDGMALSQMKELFTGLEFLQFSEFSHSGDQFIFVSTGEIKLSGLLTTRVPGASAYYIIELLRSTFLKNLIAQNSKNLNHLEIINLFDQAAAKISSIVPRHPGFEWLLCLEINSEKCYHQNGITLFVQDQGGFLELNPVKREAGRAISDVEFLKIDQSKTLLAATNGLYALMYKDGSKSYSKSMFTKLISEMTEKQNSEKMTIISEVLNEWKGEINHFEDLTIIAWNHE